MIFDSIGENELHSRYPKFEKAFDYLGSLSADTEIGEYPIEGERCFARVMDCHTIKSTSDNKVVEAHKTFADIHAVLVGEEILQLYKQNEAKPIAEYDKNRDVTFYKNDTIPHQSFRMHSGFFALFFPGEIHSPQIAPSDIPTKIKKVVIKVNLND